MKTYLALDYGTKRVGVARSFETLAEPLTILPNNDTLITVVREICTHERIDEIVVGISENEMAEKSRAFAAELRAAVGLPVHVSDETLSSVEVHRRLQTRPKRRQGEIDDLAAAVILEEFLEAL